MNIDQGNPLVEAAPDGSKVMVLFASFFSLLYLFSFLTVILDFLNFYLMPFL